MSDEQRQDRRTDLPHDQVTNDHNGQANDENDMGLYGNDDRDNQPIAQNEQHDEETAEDITPIAGANSLFVGEDDADAAENDFREETAAEVTPDEINAEGNEAHNVEGTEEREGGGTALGWTALVLSILSLFFLPVLLATAGVVTGFFAYRGGARSLGLWGIGLGLFSLLLSLFFVPLVTS